MGVPYHNIFKQYKGLRGVGPKSALIYEAILGIPRSELRPDLWPPGGITSQAPAASKPEKERSNEAIP